MIIRIVKMTFQEEHIQAFLDMFSEKKHAIAGMKGCLHLELWNDKQDLNVFFTYSHWESENDLNAYRNSELFAKVWPQTKQWFAAKPEAWSVQRV